MTETRLLQLGTINGGSTPIMATPPISVPWPPSQ